MTEKVLNEFKQDIDGYTLIPSDGGVFELYRDGEKIYSKDETGEFPEEQAMLEALSS